MRKQAEQYRKREAADLKMKKEYREKESLPERDELFNRNTQQQWQFRLSRLSKINRWQFKFFIFFYK